MERARIKYRRRRTLVSADGDVENHSSTDEIRETYWSVLKRVGRVKTIGGLAYGILARRAEEIPYFIGVGMLAEAGTSILASALYKLYQPERDVGEVKKDFWYTVICGVPLDIITMYILAPRIAPPSYTPSDMMALPLLAGLIKTTATVFTGTIISAVLRPPYDFVYNLVKRT